MASGTSAWHVAATTPTRRPWSGVSGRGLPPHLHREIEGRQVVLVHGSPDRLNEYLFADVSDEIFERHLATTGADLLIFGHTHNPFHKVLGGRHLIDSSQ